MELTIPGAVASAAREFGDAVALADLLGRPWRWPTCFPRWLGRMAPGSATASWARG